MSTDYEMTELVRKEVSKAVIGKEECIKKIMAAILAGGHVLIDDIPGVGKTTLAKAFSKAMSLESKRIQFTPDVMPSDILGFNMYQREKEEFIYCPGAVMCNLFLGDEINRTSPKTQSALLEAMEEKSVTVDGKTYLLPEPFVVIATENPVGSVGTQLLPESQLDRFMISITMGYPSLEDEIAIAEGKGNISIVENVKNVISIEQLTELKQKTEEVFVHEKIIHYICSLVRETREHAYIELGVSPRGTVAMVKMAKAMAFLENRDYVTAEDVEHIFCDVCAHRLVLRNRAKSAYRSGKEILEEILREAKKPSVKRAKASL